jgi:hypothetical protein
MRESVPLETWGKVCETAVAQAVSGDARAREWLANYLVGKPVFQVVELSSGPVGTPISLSMILAAIREAVPDPEAHVKIAQVLQRMAQEAAGDGPSDDRPGQPRLSPPMPAGHGLPQIGPNRMPAAQEQCLLERLDRGGPATSTPGAAGDGLPDAGRELAAPASGEWIDGF